MMSTFNNLRERPHASHDPLSPDPFHEPEESRVSFTHHAEARLEYVTNNMDIEQMTRIRIEVLLPIFHRRPLLHRMLSVLRFNGILVARFTDPGIDVQYLETDGRFLILNVWCAGAVRGGLASCVVPPVELPWKYIPLYREHEN